MLFSGREAREEQVKDEKPHLLAHMLRRDTTRPLSGGREKWGHREAGVKCDKDAKWRHRPESRDAQAALVQGSGDAERQPY